ncbi:hypothetical protein ACFQ48_18735 [Hymenobacter caeli]|uniref:Secreted protein n=1 Tax=Hymenobacter caeli TaxID=2735894 RepID=A0ABX2FUX5_9BACT|nr:hypothetical protein [Hymenobacter caeli]NRT20986.1 hypothetical protein [Hymenobacter caeli]
MKKALYLLSVLLLSSASTLTAGRAKPPHAPVGSGVYRSAKDFQQGKMFLQVNCQTEVHRIELHEFSNKSFINVIHEGKKNTLQKSEIFGVRDCGGHDFRFFQNKDYQLLENLGLVIYQKTAVNPVGGEELGKQMDFYFSTQLDGPIQPLTLEALKQATPGNHAFHNALDAQFQNANVADYDDFHKMYKVNQLLLNAK